MNVNLITMRRPTARRLLKQYRDRVHKKADAEYQEVEAVYAALAEGTCVLQLSEVMISAPRDEKGRPRLAIARSDQRQVYYSRSRREHADIFTIQGSGHRLARQRVMVPLTDAVDHIVPSHAGSWDGWVHGYSLIPLVPPDVAKGHDLGHHFTLWEVERWADERISVTPDRDPYLLRQITDDLFAVVGEWDLTDVERAVMAAHRVDR